MPLKELGALLLFLLAVVIAGNLWFRFVESLLARVRSLFTRHRKPPAWHPLPPEEDQDGK